jgi:predicted ABC-type ATPase
MPSIYVIAGPNGAGKSTTARALLRRYLNCEEFVNADDIARGLSAFRPETVAIRAGRLMLGRLGELARQRIDFAFETTLSSRSLARWLRRRQGEGFEIHLLYAWLPHPDMAVARVAARVAAGGHSIPEEDIRRRYHRSIGNFLEIYMHLADTWEAYDNASNTIRLIARGGRQVGSIIANTEKWREFTQGKHDSRS